MWKKVQRLVLEERFENIFVERREPNHIHFAGTRVRAGRRSTPTWPGRRGRSTRPRRAASTASGPPRCSSAAGLTRSWRWPRRGRRCWTSAAAWVSRWRATSWRRGGQSPVSTSPERCWRSPGSAFRARSGSKRTCAGSTSGGGSAASWPGPDAGEATGAVAGASVDHASLSPAEYAGCLEANRLVARAFVAEDPDCDRHSVWLARTRG
jgi:hypothetical protein